MFVSALEKLRVQAAVSISDAFMFFVFFVLLSMRASFTCC